MQVLGVGNFTDCHLCMGLTPLQITWSKKASGYGSGNSRRSNCLSFLVIPFDPHILSISEEPSMPYTSMPFLANSIELRPVPIPLLSRCCLGLTNSEHIPKRISWPYHFHSRTCLIIFFSLLVMFVDAVDYFDFPSIMVLNNRMSRQKTHRE